MTFFLHAGFGVALAALVTFTGLSVGRRDRKHVLFAVMMFVLAAYLMLAQLQYRAPDWETMRPLFRTAWWMVSTYVFLLGWFSCEYAGIRLPRFVRWGAAAITLVFIVWNAVNPETLYFERAPTVAPKVLWGNQVYMIEGTYGPGGYAQQTFTTCVFLFGIGAGIDLVRRGSLRRGAILSTSNALLLVAAAIDVQREVAGADRPYLSEFAVAVMALLMSLELAIDFRIQERKLDAAVTRLERFMTVFLDVRDRVNTPLQTLMWSFELLQERKRPASEHEVLRMQRAVEKLVELSEELKRETAADDLRGGRDGPTVR